MDNLLCGTACGVFIIHVLNLTGNGVQKEIDSVVKIRGWLFPHLKKMSKDFSQLLVSSNLKKTQDIKTVLIIQIRKIIVKNEEQNEEGSPRAADPRLE